MAAREVQQRFRKRFPTADDANSVLDKFSRQKIGQWTWKEIGEKGGRPSREFSLADQYTKHTTTQTPGNIEEVCKPPEDQVDLPKNGGQ